jgi:hypothetical protein
VREGNSALSHFFSCLVWPNLRKWFRRRKEIAVKPWIYLPPVEMPGVGQVHGDLIEDDVTKAEWALENCGAAYAYQNYRGRLQSMVDQKTWRSEAAFDILARIVRSLGDTSTAQSQYTFSYQSGAVSAEGAILNGIKA